MISPMKLFWALYGNEKHMVFYAENHRLGPGDVLEVLEGSVGWNGNPCEIIEEFRLGGQNDGLAAGRLGGTESVSDPGATHNHQPQIGSGLVMGN